MSIQYIQYFKLITGVLKRDLQLVHRRVNMNDFDEFHLGKDNFFVICK